MFYFRRYEILSDFYKKHFVDLRVLDTTCDLEEVPPPKVGSLGRFLVSPLGANFDPGGSCPQGR
jgi:hypothetical protein